MTGNERLITTFYQAFRNRDYKTMQACYADGAVFNDEVFVNLNAAEVRAMWEMFCVKGKDMQIDFSGVRADENGGSAEWIATYTFSKTGRKVVNVIKADFIIASGKIVRHTDRFNFHRWAAQALGIPGVLLGWTPFLKAKVRRQALKNLSDCMSSRKA